MITREQELIFVIRLDGTSHTHTHKLADVRELKLADCIRLLDFARSHAEGAQFL
jgi:hypothetical protein